MNGVIKCDWIPLWWFCVSDCGLAWLTDCMYVRTYVWRLQAVVIILWQIVVWYNMAAFEDAVRCLFVKSGRVGLEWEWELVMDDWNVWSIGKFVCHAGGKKQDDDDDDNIMAAIPSKIILYSRPLAKFYIPSSCVFLYFLSMVCLQKGKWWQQPIPPRDIKIEAAVIGLIWSVLGSSILTLSGSLLRIWISERFATDHNIN